MAKKLTVKEAKLVKGVASGMPKYKAAIAAGYSPKSAPEIANETLKKPNVQEALQVELAKMGVTLDKIVKPIADGLEATKVVTSPTEPDREVPDHGIRLKSSQMAQTLLGVRGDGGGGTTNNFIQVIHEQRKKYDL